MSKTVTIRLDEDTYQMIRHAAEGELRSISNFIEYATVSYLTEEAFVSDDEMSEILSESYERLHGRKPAQAKMTAVGIAAPRGTTCAQSPAPAVSRPHPRPLSSSPRKRGSRITTH